MKRFDGKVAVVTGAGSGIGEAVTRRLAEEGASIILAGRNQDKLQQVADSLPVRCQGIVKVTDVSVQADVQALIDFAIGQGGGLDVLVNAAGVATEGTVTETSSDDWHRTFATNVDGIFHACRAAMPYLKTRRGCIVNVASVSGLGGDWGMLAYNASKGAVVNLTRAMAMDHALDGVRVNAVCPSFTLTPMTEDMQDNPDILARFAERIPMGRPARPEEIAAVVAFLASADAGFVTGVNLPVDGGLSASNGQPRM